MLVLISLVFAVFLGGTRAQRLPMSKCTLAELMLDLRSCNTDFIRSMMKNPKSDCSTELKTMNDCAVNSSKSCFPGLKEAAVKMILQNFLTEQVMCDRAGVQYPASMGPNATLPCKITEKEYTIGVNNCSNKMLSLWTTNRADPEICGEYKASKDCVRNLIDSSCNFSSVDWFKALMNSMLGDYNPFCTNGVDPTTAPTTVPTTVPTDSHKTTVKAGSQPTSLTGLLVVVPLVLSIAMG